MFASVKFIRRGFVVLLVCLGSALYLRYADRPVDAIFIFPNDVGLTLQGMIPAQTQLNVSAFYSSPRCIPDEYLQQEGLPSYVPDELHNRPLSTLNLIFSQDTAPHPYRLDLPLDRFGKCDWRLRSIMTEFIYRPNSLRFRWYRYWFAIETCTDDVLGNPQPCEQTLSFRPVVYTLRHEKGDNKDAYVSEGPASIGPSGAELLLPIEKALRSSPELWPVFVDLRKKTTVNVSLEMRPEYIVRLIKQPDGRGSTVIYPDGTTWLYSSSGNVLPAANVHTGVQTTLYSPYRRESCLNTVQSAKKTEQKGFGWENDYCR